MTGDRTPSSRALTREAAIAAEKAKTEKAKESKK